MSTRQIVKRVEKVAALIRPRSDGFFTLEELCRSLWRQGKEEFPGRGAAAVTLLFFG